MTEELSAHCIHNQYRNVCCDFFFFSSFLVNYSFIPAFLLKCIFFMAWMIARQTTWFGISLLLCWLRFFPIHSFDHCGAFGNGWNILLTFLQISAFYFFLDYLNHFFPCGQQIKWFLPLVGMPWFVRFQNTLNNSWGGKSVVPKSQALAKHWCSVQSWTWLIYINPV